MVGMDLFRIAMEYHSDGGSQLESSPFSLKSTGFEHTVSSPYKCQSNRKAVKIAKHLLKGCRDPYLVEEYSYQRWNGFKSLPEAVCLKDKRSCSNG